MKNVMPTILTCFMVFTILVTSCTNRSQTLEPETTAEEITTVMTASPQRQGNAQKGYDYLVNGNYVDGGVPYNFFKSFKSFLGEADNNILQRTGNNVDVPYNYTAIVGTYGNWVVGPNCLTCHAAKINDEFIIGLGNTSIDFTEDRYSALLGVTDAYVKNNYGTNSTMWKDYYPFSRGFGTLAPSTKTETVGVNPADKFALILAAHRNPQNLTWTTQDNLGIPAEVVATDVPAWWILRKKNVMFYNGAGTGDFAKIMMASSLVSLEDTVKARDVDTHFPDVYAYIKSLPVPVYKGSINQSKVSQGKLIYEANCARCHGSSNNKEDYPNLMVNLESIGTDPQLATANFANSKFVDWYNKSWFNTGKNAAKLIPQRGYIAPPLDGIWATAPYLHNGSVPTLSDLLNSTQRPKYWKRTYKNNDYDSNKMGWNYTAENTKTDKYTYDTTLPGYSNKGHIYGDKLTENERLVVIEYLKTL